MTNDARSKTDVGPYVYGIRWRRCKDCSLRVWETKRGKLSRHIAKPEHEGEDPFALSSSSIHHSTPRCDGSGS